MSLDQKEAGPSGLQIGIDVPQSAELPATYEELLGRVHSLQHQLDEANAKTLSMEDARDEVKDLRADVSRMLDDLKSVRELCLDAVRQADLTISAIEGEPLIDSPRLSAREEVSGLAIQGLAQGVERRSFDPSLIDARARHNRVQALSVEARLGRDRSSA